MFESLLKFLAKRDLKQYKFLNKQTWSHLKVVKNNSSILANIWCDRSINLDLRLYFKLVFFACFNKYNEVLLIESRKKEICYPHVTIINRVVSMKKLSEGIENVFV